MLADMPKLPATWILIRCACCKTKTRGQEGICAVIRLSESRLSHLSHLLIDGLRKGGLVDLPTKQGRCSRPNKSCTLFPARRLD
jgi:hypothetical protein